MADASPTSQRRDLSKVTVTAALNSGSGRFPCPPEQSKVSNTKNNCGGEEEIKYWLHFRQQKKSENYQMEPEGLLSCGCVTGHSDKRRLLHGGGFSVRVSRVL